ncbi:MAG: hypothetical protein KH330_10685 [Clostridiales bacterium]|nr:hypothetical protein [Clostridiales bacterium]
MSKYIVLEKKQFYNEMKILSQIGEPKDERRSKSIFGDRIQIRKWTWLEELRDSSFLRRLTETSRKRREGTWIRKKYKRE